MKLYYSPGACSLSPHIILRETGSTFDLVRTDTRTKTMEGGGDYWKINPNGYVPALQLDDGTVLTEGPAIVQYIADKAGATKLAPANGTLERYKLQSWLNYVSSELHKGFSPLFNPNMPDAAKTIVRERLAQRFAVLDKHLASNDYLAGKDFTVVDAYAFTVLNWTKKLNIDLSPYTSIEAYRARIGERPSVKAAMQAEGLTK